MTMSETSEDKARTLAALRGRIDAIDTQMHRLLMERGAVIEALIEAKGSQRPGAAFRPAREADMMRRIVARHAGDLPLATVEHIWREIIATFTCMQAPFEVAVDVSVEAERMRDRARFIFGFSVGLNPANGPAAVIERVAAGNDLGLVARAAEGAWWSALTGEERPQIMAILPFIRTEQTPADVPAFVISPPLADPTPAEVAVFAVTAAAALPALDETTVLAATESDGRVLVLLAEAGGRDVEELAKRLGARGCKAEEIAPVGGFARPIDRTGSPVDLAALAWRPGEGG